MIWPSLRVQLHFFGRRHMERYATNFLDRFPTAFRGYTASLHLASIHARTLLVNELFKLLNLVGGRPFPNFS